MYELVCICPIQVSILIKESDTLCALSGFDNKLNRAGIKPFLALVNPRRQRLVVKSAVMLFPKFHLNIETTAVCGRHNFIRIEAAIREPLATFNASYSDV